MKQSSNVFPMLNKILFLIPLSILIFVILAPLLVRAILPGIRSIEPGESRLNKVCFGFMVPADLHRFVLQENITFNDIRANKDECFGVDVYYGG